jgi:hypothetical protein
MKIQYYLIHGVDASRKPRMEAEFEKAGIEKERVKWVLHPNKDELSDELIRNIVIQTESYTCGVWKPAGWLGKGQISCSYKHYLALKDIVENDYDYGVIMEDNMKFIGNVPDRVHQYIGQLNSFYTDKWDILFDLKYGKYVEGPTDPNRLVYPKSNEINEFGHGGTRCAQFYLLTRDCAKRLYENYLPFNNAPDWWMNDLFRKLDIRSFWADPPNVDIWPHHSTAN